MGEIIRESWSGMDSGSARWIRRSGVISSRNTFCEEPKGTVFA
jgi:hypothetical protein